MFSTFERIVAFRYLRAQRKEGFISVTAWFSLMGICLGVATLIIVMAVMNGFRAELLDRIIGINAHINVSNYGLPVKNFDELAKKIKTVDGITASVPVIEGQVMATANGGSTGAIVRSMRPEDLRNKSLIANNIKVGNLESFANRNTVILGKRLAINLGLRIGDRITLISPKTNNVFIGAIPRLKEYIVGAMFEIGMYEYDNGIIFMPLSEGQRYFKLPNAVNRIEVMTENADKADYLSVEVSKYLGNSFRVVDWKQENSHFFNSLKVERNVMFLILTLIILVAAFNIISSMIMLVNDKARAIAILRTMGASRFAIMRIFIMAGSSVGVIGTILGSLLGIGFSLNIETIRRWIENLADTELFAAEIYFLSQLPAKIEPMEVTMVISMALFLSFAATIYPAWRAANINPSEGVHHD